MRKRPQRSSGQVVDHALAVWAYQGHCAGRFNQILFRPTSVAADFSEASRVADDTPGTSRSQPPDGFNCLFDRYGQKHRIRGLREIFDRRETVQSAHLLPIGIYRPYIARKADASGFTDCNRGIAPADESGMARLQQPLQIGTLRRRHAPCGLNMDREMM